MIHSCFLYAVFLMRALLFIGSSTCTWRAAMWFPSRGCVHWSGKGDFCVVGKSRQVIDCDTGCRECICFFVMRATTYLEIGYDSSLQRFGSTVGKYYRRILNGTHHVLWSMYCYGYLVVHNEDFPACRHTSTLSSWALVNSAVDSWITSTSRPCFH